MSTNKSKKKKRKKRDKPLPKINLEARQPRPRPVSWGSPREVLKKAREYPILGCWIDKHWKEQGLARVVIARDKDFGRALFGSFLIDYYCLGIKDCDWKTDISVNTLKRNLPKMCGTPEPCSPEFAHELIYGALDYAERFGFQPHPDFKQARLVLDPPESHPERHNIEFGKDGKPFYIAGPYDNPQRDIATLKRTAGEGNFHYLIGLGDPGGIDF